MIQLHIDNKWRVNCSGELTVPLPASIVWGQMRDLLRFICIDPLHAAARTLDGQPPRQGSRLIIQHRFLGLGPDRLSRVLTWHEGRGYSLSDLSQRGNRTGFPHICTYHVAPITETTSRLLITARGRWTATFLPRWAAKLWMWWILASTEAHLRHELNALHAWLCRPVTTGSK
jgi:hypothetical protein